MSAPEVSIIVPFYGVEAYARGCIESILAQTFGDFELILVDDGSPDRCGEIVDSYAHDPRVRVIHKPNGGLSDARNAGLDIARGTYVCFVDGDDEVDDDLLERVIPEMRRGFDLVSFGYRAYYEDGRDYAWTAPVKDRIVALGTQEERFEHLCDTLLGNTHYWSVWSNCYRRDIIEEMSLRFYDNKAIFAEDMLFTACYLSHATSVRMLPFAPNRYLIRSSSLTGTFDRHGSLDRFDLLAHELLRHYETADGCELFCERFHILHYIVVRGRLIDVSKDWLSRVMGLDEARRYVRESSVDFELLSTDARKSRGCDRMRRKYREETITKAVVEVLGVPCVLYPASPALKVAATLLKAAITALMPLHTVRLRVSAAFGDASRR